MLHNISKLVRGLIILIALSTTTLMGKVTIEQDYENYSRVMESPIDIRYTETKYSTNHALFKIRKYESNNNYNPKPNPYSSATTAYQFLKGTLKRVMKSYNASHSRKIYSAVSPSNQNRLARHHLNNIHKELRGVVPKNYLTDYLAWQCGVVGVQTKMAQLYDDAEITSKDLKNIRNNVSRAKLKEIRRDLMSLLRVEAMDFGITLPKWLLNKETITYAQFTNITKKYFSGIDYDEYVNDIARKHILKEWLLYTVNNFSK